METNNKIKLEGTKQKTVKKYDKMEEGGKRGRQRSRQIGEIRSRSEAGVCYGRVRGEPTQTNILLTQRKIWTSQSIGHSMTRIVVQQQTDKCCFTFSQFILQFDHQKMIIPLLIFYLLINSHFEMNLLHLNSSPTQTPESLTPMALWFHAVILPD